MDNLNPKAHLIVDVMDFSNNRWTVRIYLFDGAAHMTTMSRWNVVPIEGDPAKRGRVVVDCLGQNGDKVAVVLPEAINELGTNISVDSKHIEKHRRPIEQIVQETLDQDKK